MGMDTLGHDKQRKCEQITNRKYTACYTNHGELGPHWADCILKDVEGNVIYEDFVNYKTTQWQENIQYIKKIPMRELTAEELINLTAIERLAQQISNKVHVPWEEIVGCFKVEDLGEKEMMDETIAKMKLIADTDFKTEGEDIMPRLDFIVSEEIKNKLKDVAKAENRSMTKELEFIIADRYRQLCKDMTQHREDGLCPCEKCFNGKYHSQSKLTIPTITYSKSDAKVILMTYERVKKNNDDGTYIYEWIEVKNGENNA